MKFSALLAAIGLAPATPEAAKATREAARATLDSVQALFAAANLPLEQMLEAGPDSLKTHLASLDRSAEFTALEEKLVQAQADAQAVTESLSAEKTAHGVTAAALKVHADLLAATGFKPDPKATEADVKKSFAAHVEQQAAALLAKDGRPPVAHVAKDALSANATPAATTDAEHLAKWQSFAAGSKERMDYGAQHFSAIQRALAALPPENAS